MAEETKKPSLKRIIAEINKAANENVLGFMSQMPNLDIKRLSTGVPSLDLALGGGIPSGKIVEFFGAPSVGKSLISLLTIAEAQRNGLECIYLDCEDSMDINWCKTLGVDTDKLILGQSSMGEDTLELVIKLLKSEPAIIVVDSVASMVSRAELEEEDIGKSFMALKARLMSKAMRLILNQNKSTTIIFINQIRSTLAMYGPQFTTPGGIALKFAASVRVEIKKTEELHEEDKKSKPVIGQVVAFKIVKNKVSPPFLTGSFKFFFDGRIA